MPRNSHCLIISQSARALTVSAARAGLQVYTIDYFADQDTRTVALKTVQAKSHPDGSFKSSSLLQCMAECTRLPISGVVTGSGLETGDAEVYDFISRHWSLWGNSRETVRTCKDPENFATMLEKLGIPTPEIALKGPQRRGEWLLKKKGGCGGGHLRHYSNGDPVADDDYLQEKINGVIHSVVFLADGHSAIIIGLNEIWSVAPEKGNYRYAGAVTVPRAPESLVQSLQEAVMSLTKALGLKGLCGLDMALTESGSWFLLELNPRPTATFELHEIDTSLFYAHLQACQGRLVPVIVTEKPFRAYRIIYADKSFIMPEVDWPDWACDRPVNGRIIEAGEPVCSIQAQAGTRAEINQLLHNRLTSLRQLMGMDKLAA